MNPKQFHSGIALGIALSTTGWVIHHYGTHYTGPGVGLRDLAAWTLLLTAVAVITVTCARTALGPRRPSRVPDGLRGPRAFPRSPSTRTVTPSLASGGGLRGILPTPRSNSTPCP
ncbi:hypothetical protein [Streptomyces erythrochromogenes]|uniref:hypothetical protein n=1 Tax=Streptomyces erythrochromogenes TaxID=285574 RepID=UPI0038642A2D|nr:hypothetical protein OG364_00950 [Streptomyces erythrochromogenes]WST98360.1 hypothetical protein OG364_40585 [Streptomyces erythrochromogenes]